MAITNQARRPRPLVARALFVAGAALLVAWLEPAPHADVYRADFGASAAIAIISIIGGLFGLFKGKADSNISAALFSMRGAVVEFGKKLVDYISRAGAFLSRVIGALRRFYQQFIAPLVTTIAGIIARISRVLNRILGPIIRAVMKFRKWLLTFYDKVLRPILDTIAAVRAVLRILGKLGVKAAEKLDDALAGVEDKIRGAYLSLLSKTNEIIDVLNRIVTLDGLLQRVTLLNSLYSYRRDWINQFYWAQSRKLTPGEEQSLSTIPEAREPIEMAATLRSYLVFRDGPLRARVDEMARSLELRLEGRFRG
jgi:hypothetical protein